MAENEKRETATDEIEITDKMLEAGLSVFHSYDSRFEEAEGFVIRLFEAMTAARKIPDNETRPESGRDL